jgi:hypothetical protein
MKKITPLWREAETAREWQLRLSTNPRGAPAPARAAQQVRSLRSVLSRDVTSPLIGRGSLAAEARIWPLQTRRFAVSLKRIRARRAGMSSVVVEKSIPQDAPVRPAGTRYIFLSMTNRFGFELYLPSGAPARRHRA